MNVTIKGNIATITGVSGISGVFRTITDLRIENFSVALISKAVYDVSFPMTREHHQLFAGQIHRYNAEQRAKNPHLKPKGPDGTPPKGTPPRGGAGNTKEFVNTFAIAA